MRLLWKADTKHVAWWWALLSFASIGNIGLWLLLYAHADVGGGIHEAPNANLMLALCAAYVFGCAFRSFLPRADVQRFCLFDTWLSSVVIGRSVATVAEICFAAQWAIMLFWLGDSAGVEATCRIALMVVPLIIVAQVCSWVGVLTTNTLANAVENSIWALTFGLIALGLLPLLAKFEGVVLAAMIVATVGIAAYLAFLIIVDVPMYLRRWRQLRASEESVFGLIDGFRDAARRRIVTHDLAHWKAEMPWMSLYFTGAVWASLALSFSYSLGEHLPRYRTDPVVQQDTTPSAPLLAEERERPLLRFRAMSSDAWAGP